MIALITGATAGIGKSTAYKLAENNYNLILTGRRKDRLDNIKNEIEKKYGVKVLTLCFDIRNKIECQNALNGLPDEWKQIDVLINNAGLAQGLATIPNGLEEDWDTMIDTNIKGFLYVSKIVSNWMINRKQGHIINVGSIAGKEVYPNGNVYCATKHAVDALSKAMRMELLPFNIRVSAIHPGMVETEFSLVRFKGNAERAKQTYQGLQPLTADDIADAIWWMINRPAHVNINEMIITPTAQANSRDIIKN
ncbi:MAG TPA: SDR family NAD(P)-dependent oxidoreductase [Bacteroidia bacterium]|nr:SDR family NAD(P)-dependent oxidoreductase [Bacteroidia bacterium]